MELNGDTLFFIVEILGTIAFAISGAMIGIDRELDLFGVIFMGCITACGGGMLRDVILGQTPPQSFINAVYLSSSAVTGLLVFLYSWRRHKRLTDLHAIGSITLDIDMPLNVIDAAGLGIFSVIGVQNTINAGYGENVFFCVFLGACTGGRRYAPRYDEQRYPRYFPQTHLCNCLYHWCHLLLLSDALRPRHGNRRDHRTGHCSACTGFQVPLVSAENRNKHLLQRKLNYIPRVMERIASITLFRN